MAAIITNIQTVIQNAITQIYAIRLADVADILIVAYLIYRLIAFVRKTSMSRIAKGIIFLLLMLWISGELRLNVVNFLIRNTVSLGLLALVVLFQPEMRRALEKVGSNNMRGIFARERLGLNLESAITQTVVACAEMSRMRVGALIVYERANRLSDQMSTGTMIDAGTTAELLKNIFHPNAPLHDGAAIIRDGRIAAAGCMLPLSSNPNLSRELGMRHRAGIGMSESSDAVVAIVSEETGAISVAVDGMLKRHLSPDTFERLLRNELLPDADAKKKSGFFSIFKKVKKNGKEVGKE